MLQSQWRSHRNKTFKTKQRKKHRTQKDEKPAFKKIGRKCRLE